MLSDLRLCNGIRHKFGDDHCLCAIQRIHMNRTHSSHAIYILNGRQYDESMHNFYGRSLFLLLRHFVPFGNWWRHDFEFYCLFSIFFVRLCVHLFLCIFAWALVDTFFYRIRMLIADSQFSECLWKLMMMMMELIIFRITTITSNKSLGFDLEWASAVLIHSRCSSQKMWASNEEIQTRLNDHEQQPKIKTIDRIEHKFVRYVTMSRIFFLRFKPFSTLLPF